MTDWATSSEETSGGRRSAPVLSVVVPARDRLDKLAMCVQTVLNGEEFPRVEVVISDNSVDGIPTASGPLQSPQVRVVRPRSPLHMTDNFEFGRRAAQGQWMMFLGADDGVVSTRLGAFVDYLESCKSDCVVGPTVGFSWPDMSERHEGRLSWWVAPSTDPSVVDTRKALEEVMASIHDPSTLDSSKLPTPYMHGAVRSTALSRLAHGPHNQVFRTQAPDIYIMMALLHTIPTYEILPWAIGIQGVSRQSNGHMSLERSQEWSEHPDRAITISEQAVGTLGPKGLNSDIVATYRDAILTAAELSGFPVDEVDTRGDIITSPAPNAATRRLAIDSVTTWAGSYGRISRLFQRLSSAARRVRAGESYYYLRSVSISNSVRASEAVTTVDYVESRRKRPAHPQTGGAFLTGLKALRKSGGSRGWRLSSPRLLTPLVYQSGATTS